MHPNTRPGVAMIELIFAISVMGIVLMSAPTLIATAQQSTSVALQQEGINEAASKLAMIETYEWDENDTDRKCIPPVLTVTDGDSHLNEQASSFRRAGVPLQSNSRTFACNSHRLAASPLGSEGDTDDIDDFIGDSNLTIIGVGSGGSDYLEQDTVNLNTAVAYIDDTASYNSQTITYAPGSNAASGKTTNIKKITVTLTSTSPTSELIKTIRLTAFSSNIGSTEFARKVIP